MYQDPIKDIYAEKEFAHTYPRYILRYIQGIYKVYTRHILIQGIRKIPLLKKLFPWNEKTLSFCVMRNQSKKESIQIVHTIGGKLEQYKNYFLYMIDLLE